MEKVQKNVQVRP